NSSETLESLFEKVSGNADVLCLCGDLTHLGLAAEAERLGNDLRSCRIPVVAVLGNHDYQSGQAEDIKKVLRAAKVVVPEEAETIDHFDVDVVFHGHAHHGTYQGKTVKGTPVYNCCFQLVQRVTPEQPYALIEV